MKVITCHYNTALCDWNWAIAEALGENGMDGVGVVICFPKSVSPDLRYQHTDQEQMDFHGAEQARNACESFKKAGSNCG